MNAGNDQRSLYYSATSRRVMVLAKSWKRKRTLVVPALPQVLCNVTTGFGTSKKLEKKKNAGSNL
jgi:hypothetical protein